MTLLEYCYQHKYFKALNFAYNTRLKGTYNNAEYMQYFKDGNSAGVYTCVRNEVNLEHKDKGLYDYTGLMYSGAYGYKSTVDLHIEF